MTENFDMEKEHNLPNLFLSSWEHCKSWSLNNGNNIGKWIEIEIHKAPISSH